MTPHFNQLNPAEAERLAVLAEECGEAVQEIGKILRHGYESKYPDGGPTNRERLEYELGHVSCAVLRMRKAGDVAVSRIDKSCEEKIVSSAEYLHHQA